MKLGLRMLLLLAAVVCFIIAAIATTHVWDWIAIGLACSAGAVLVRELGWDKPMMSMMHR
ncbi:MAG: hypothetical protein ACYDA3_12060 [Gaiellaceae bacterium]